MTREEEIRDRLEKATPPPFVVTETGTVRCPLCDGEGEVDSVLLEQDAFPVQVQVYGIGTDFKAHEAFLHHAPDDLRYLLARNEELQREKEKMQAVVDAAIAASYEYFHPATGDGDSIGKMHRLRDAISALDAKEQDDD